MCSLTAIRGDLSEFIPKWSSSQEQRKCGDVSVSLTTTSLTLHCVFCEFYSDTLEKFFEHLKKQHLNVLAIETLLWPEATINELQIKEEELGLIEAKTEDDLNSLPENAADPLMAEENISNGGLVKSESIETLLSDAPSDHKPQFNSDAEKPKSEHICKLIHYIREHPLLWNTQLVPHYIRSERQTAIESITKLLLKEYPFLSIDTRYVRKKLKDLKNIYYNYNIGGTKPNKNHEKYYELLHFLKDHENSKTQKKKCIVCNKEVNCIGRHIQKYHCGNDALLKCDVCEEMLPSKRQMQRHMHAIHQRYDCEHCTREPFRNARSLRHHIESKHPEIELPPKHPCAGPQERICELCGLQFKSQVNLRSHLKGFHLQLRPYACPDCPRKFQKPDKLRSHRNSTHLNNREFACDVCSKAFFDRKTMIQHKRLHSDVMNYVCRVCGKAFRQAPALHSHMKSHP